MDVTIKITAKITIDVKNESRPTSFPDPKRFSSLFDAPQERRIYVLPHAVFPDGGSWYISTLHGATLDLRAASRLPIWIYQGKVNIWRKDYDEIQVKHTIEPDEIPIKYRIPVQWL
jgi:hypothetical protein